jgi:hypothetical protein
VANVTVTVRETATHNNPEELARALSQLQSVQELRDVDPYNWSYQALKNLVEQYGCIVGYPDRTFRGEQALSRYEFAAGLNACMEALERRMIAAIKAQAEAQTPPASESTPAGQQDTTEDIPQMFNRAFYHNTGTLNDLYDISGQMNTMLGWRSFLEGSFVENLIARDSEVMRAIYQDLVNQPTSGPRLRTQDLANPFSSSLNENPAYLRTAEPTAVTTDTTITITQPSYNFP